MSTRGRQEQLQEVLSIRSSQVQELQNNLHEKEKQNDTLHRDNSTLKSNLTKKEFKEKEMMVEIQKLESRVIKSEANESTLSTEINSLKLEVGKKSDHEAKLLNEIHVLQTDVHDKDIAIGLLKEQLNEALQNLTLFKNALDERHRLDELVDVQKRQELEMMSKVQTKQESTNERSSDKQHTVPHVRIEVTHIHRYTFFFN